ncbi:MAG TPA: hypothetical protein P5291_00985 [Flavobacteriales bacterium]|nr:hypothetical protein [Flavobacteriales bacterium]
MRISLSNGKPRCTTAGELTMSGVKNLDQQDRIDSCQQEFSQVRP